MPYFHIGTFLFVHTSVWPYVQLLHFERVSCHAPDKCCHAGSGFENRAHLRKSVAITNTATTCTAGIAQDTHDHDVRTVPSTAVHE
uniref:Putative secreted protein n=1 Tax=Rhipicephalus microplus TaxID=6941 RepID=A0A6G5A3S1_RHIMP